MNRSSHSLGARPLVISPAISLALGGGHASLVSDPKQHKPALIQTERGSLEAVECITDAQGEPENQVQRPHPAGNNAPNHMPEVAWCGHPHRCPGQTPRLTQTLEARCSHSSCYTATSPACPRSWEAVCAWGGRGPASKSGVGGGRKTWTEEGGPGAGHAEGRQ